ncbi:MAG TPA: DUF2958 domain-containing protein [archaeon]|jgi:hypothetical protein|nr:DUF2958 domain-containing protein [archaeon]
MKIITKEIEEAFEKQGYTGDKSADEIKVVMKLFNPCGAGTWYIYEKIDDDIYMCFANLGDPTFAECGSVSLSELMSLRLPFGLKIERDMYFKPLSMTLKEVMDKVESGVHV